MRRCAGGWIVAVCAVALCAGCRSETARQSARGSGSETVSQPSVPPLPDVSRLDESLQQRVRSDHAALASTVQSGSREESAEALGRMGTLLFALELHRPAESFFAAARAMNAADMRWPYYLAHTHRALHQPETAVTFFEVSHALDPRHVPTLIWLGETYLTLSRPADAERQLAAAVELEPSSVAGWFRRGRAALALNDAANAVRYLEHALALDPSSDAIHYQLGLAYRAIGQRAKAEQHLKRRGDAATIVPNDPLIDSLPAMVESGAAYLTRGLEAVDRRDWPAAVANLRKASELSPKDEAVHLNLGTALYLSGDRAGARAAFEEAIRVAPDLPKPHFTLGLLAESERRDREAIEHFTAAVRLDPNYVEAQASLADAKRRTGQVQASLEHYQKVLSLNPAASQARFGYAMGLVRLGRYAEALTWLRAAAAMHPDQPGFTHALARVLAASPDDSVRNGGEAVRLTTALWQSNRGWTLLETRAMAAAEVGAFDDAIKLQESAIQEAVMADQRAAAAHMRDILARYRLGLPCRTPWRIDDPIFAPRPSS